MTTPLARHLRAEIAAQGPITMARYMAEALGHPEHGYYMTRDPFGAAGDFITAPEVSQMFGELIGAWCADVWMQMGQPNPIQLVELGPGRGTLMKDALRVTQQVPGFHSATRLHLVETSPRLRDLQATTLTGSTPNWHDSVTDIPAGPRLLIANELFDALPVHQFQFSDGHWHERLVDAATDEDGLRLALDPSPATNAALDRFTLPQEGSIAEVCPAGVALAREIATQISTENGAALLIDYGHTECGYGDTVQAVRAHQARSIFEAPGTVDLTAHVDFAALAEAARDAGTAIWGPVVQGNFLNQLGIAARATTLSTASPPDSRDIASALDRLTHPDEMGSLFKVLAFTSASLHPAGFD